MLPQEILMARAVRYCADTNNLTVDAISRLDSQTLAHFQDLTVSVAEDMRYNQLKYFRPFEHQKKFFATGAQSDRRGILAANRIGKTVSTCFELAVHLTGEYPEWWTGKRFNKPIAAFVAGESWDQVARVLQDELMGSSDGKITQDIGTGTIPRANIVFETMRSEGANIMSVEIKHRSGQKSRLTFGNYTQEVRNMQGFKLDIVVFDEQPPDDMFSELVTRTATLQGQVLCSFTPLKGLNGLVSKFWNREEGYDFVRVSWDDVPEYDPWGQPFLLQETRRQLERDYLPHEREARIAGKPVMGKGAVFQLRTWPTYKTGDYDFKTMNDIERIIALDLGLVNDATVITLMYSNPKEQLLWLDRQIIVKGVEEANPVNYVNHLLRPEVFGCPIVLPADAGTQGRYTMSALSIRELFEQYGLNVDPHPIMNPPDPEGRQTNHKSYGINMMRQMLEAGTFMINDSCQTFITQAQNYYVDEKGRFSDPDDAIDSARYALMGCLQQLSEPYDGLNSQARMAQARQRIETIKLQKQINRPQIKKTYDPATGSTI